MATVLLTGATGFVGRHCLGPLREAGDEVHAVTGRPDREIPEDSWPDLHWHQVDLLDPDRMRDLVAAVRPTHLLHFAWYGTPGKYWSSPDNLRWLRASLVLLEEFAKHGGERAVVAGTCAEYDWRYGYCSEELTPLRPATFYGSCKHALQCAFEGYGKAAGVSTAWGRMFFLYGPHEHPARFVPAVVNSLLKGETARVSHGNQIRDYLYVLDAAAAFVRLLHSNVTGPVNIASGRPISLKDIVATIAAHVGRPDLVALGAIPAAPGEPRVLLADVTRLREELKWTHATPLDAGLTETVTWWRMRARLQSPRS